MNRKINLNGLFVIALKACEAVVAAGLAIAFARWLGPEQFGVFAFGLAAITLLIIPIKNGASVMITKLVAETGQNQMGQNQMGQQAIPVILASIRVTVFYTMALCSLAWLIVYLGIGPISLMLGVAYFAIALAFLGAIGIIEGIMRGLFRPNTAILIGTILVPLIALIGGASIRLSGTDLALEWAIGLYVAATVVTLLIAIGLVWPAISTLKWGASGETISGPAWLAMALPFIGVTGLLVLNRQIDVLVLGVIAGEETAGIFRLAAQAAILTTFGVQALGHLYAPILARSDNQATQEIAAILRQSVGLSMLVAIGAIGFLAVAGEWVIKMLAGPPYLPAYPAMLLLCAANLAVAANGAAMQALIMKGKEGAVSKVLAISAVLALGAHSILVPQFGLMGAAYATSAAIVFWSISIRWIACKNWDLNIVAFTPIAREEQT